GRKSPVANSSAAAIVVNDASAIVGMMMLLLRHDRACAMNPKPTRTPPLIQVDIAFRRTHASQTSGPMMSMDVELVIAIAKRASAGSFAATKSHVRAYRIPTLMPAARDITPKSLSAR